MYYNYLLGQVKDSNITSNARKSFPLDEEIDQILGTRAASCLPVVVASGGGGYSAADVDLPAFEEHASEMEARMRERAGARGQDHG